MFADPALKAVICISQMVRDDIRRHFALPDDKLHVIYNAVDPREFSPGVRDAARGDARASSASPTTTSRSCSWARAMRARACRPRCARSRGCPRAARLVVVGRDKASGALRRRSRAAPACATASSSPGPQQDPRPFLGAADAFVLPTLYDPLSNAVLEALACGLPVVTSRRCGAGELVVAHGAGWICDADDDAALAAHMERAARRRRARARSPRARRRGRGADAGGDGAAAARALRRARRGTRAIIAHRASAARAGRSRVPPSRRRLRHSRPHVRHHRLPLRRSSRARRAAGDDRGARASRARRRRLSLRRPGRASATAGCR